MDLNCKYKDIIVNRHSDSLNSNMTTTKIVNEILPGKMYEITNDNLILSDFEKSSIPIEDGENEYVVIKNNWIDAKNIYTKESNILGFSGKFIANTNTIKIPISKNYSFFGIKMFKKGDHLNFPDLKTNIPVSYMDVGINYIDEYIMKKAGGVYLEYHDRPHFHMPLNADSKGYMIIGKVVDDDLLLAAFNIPFGYALYTPENIVHNDCFLLGQYLVVYSKTKYYSNVIMKNKNNEPVKVEII